jgi:hypothetical protein
MLFLPVKISHNVAILTSLWRYLSPWRTEARTEAVGQDTSSFVSQLSELHVSCPFIS